MAVYTKEYESQPEAILTNVIICPAVDLSANVAVPVHCQVENVLWDTGATNTLISQEVVNALGLQPKNKALISSAGGDVESWTYLVHVILPTGTAELNVQALLNDNSDYDVVIGMDIINSCDFCYTNKDGKSTFSFIKYYLDKTLPPEANGKNPPLIIPYNAMINFIKATSTDSEHVRIVTAEQCHYKSGDKVRVIAGDFKGVVGKVARIAGQQRIVVEISGLCLVATAYIPTDFIEIVK